MVLEQPLVIQPVSGTNTITAAQWRTITDFLIGLDGVAKPGDLKVSQRAAGANMTVDLTAGLWSVTGSSLANQGTYISRSTAVANVAVSPAPGSGTRTDLIVAQVQDDQSDSSGQMRQQMLAVTGIVGAGVPATPANALPLASIVIPAGKASIVNADITDLRVRAAAVGPAVQAGTFTVTFVAGVASATVNFPHAFAGVPSVAPSSGVITGNTQTVIDVSSVTTSGFVYRCTPAAGGSYAGTVTGYYIAVY